MYYIQAFNIYVIKRVKSRQTQRINCLLIQNITKVFCLSLQTKNKIFLTDEN